MSDSERHSDSDSSEEDRPWEQPGAMRLDCVPNWGEFLRRLANVSLACGALSMIVPPTAILGFFFGLLTAALAAHDLKRIKAGLSDPNGQTLVEWAQERAVSGMCLSLFGWPVGCVLYFVLLHLAK
jgi:hypothetical protein